MRTSNLLPMILLPLLLVACSRDDAPAAGTAASPAAADGEAPAATAPPASEAAPATEAPAAGGLDLDGFELSMDRVDRWIDANRKISAVVQQDRSLEDVVAANANEPRDTYIARLESSPRVAAAIESAGLTTREYALTTETLIGSVLALGMVDAGAIPELPPAMRDSQPLRFVQANRAEIDAKLQALQRGQE